MERDYQEPQSEAKVPSRIPQELAGKTLARASSAEEVGLPEGPSKTVSSPRSQSDPGSTTRFAEQIHQYIREHIRLGDQKAAFIFAASAAFLAFLYQNDLSSRWLKSLNQWSLGDVLAFIAMLGLAGSALLSFWVVVPRTKGSRRGVLFWEAIAEFETSGEYARIVSELSHADMAAAQLEHCHQLAKVCRQKYFYLNLSVWVGLLGFGAAIIYLLFF